MTAQLGANSIVGSQLILYPFSVELISEEYISWLNDKTLMRYSQQSERHHTRASCLDFVNSFTASPNFFWSVHQADTKKQIGTMSAYRDTHTNIADLGILIGDRSTRGAGKEAWGMAMRFLFEEVKIRKLTGGTVAPNIAMRKIFEHYHMQQEACLRKEHILNGQECDVLRYGLFREEWLDPSYKSKVACNSAL